MIFVKFDRNLPEWIEICQNGPKLMIFCEIKISYQYFAGMLINFRPGKFWHFLLCPISRKVMPNFFVKNDIYIYIYIYMVLIIVLFGLHRVGDNGHFERTFRE